MARAISFLIFDVFPHLNMDCLQHTERVEWGLEDDRSGRRFIFCPERFQPLPDGTFLQKTMLAFLFQRDLSKNFCSI